MRLRLLGPVCVDRGGGDVFEPSSRQQRAVLTVLGLRVRTVVAEDRLIDAVWPEDPPPSARRALHALLSRLRSQLGSEIRLQRSGTGYILDLPAPGTDVEDVALLRDVAVAAGASGDHQSAAAAFRQALDQWRGDALIEFADHPFATGEHTRLAELRLELFEAAIGAELAAGRASQVVAEVEHLVVEHPLRERLWHHLALALYRTGRQGEAVRAIDRCRRVLTEELGISPGAELRRLERLILDQDDSLLPPFAAGGGTAPADPTMTAQHNLPVDLTSFVGRVQESGLATLALERHRLVTIVGVGGVGKTRLAQHIGQTIADRYADGLWWIDLAALAPGAPVGEAVSRTLGIADTLGADPVDGLLSVLEHWVTLLVLDNCEHVRADVAAVVRRLLVRCPGVTVLATSRERLGVAGEQAVDLPPLPVPAVGTVDPEVLAGFDAMRLLLERGASIRRDLSMGTDNALAMARLCRAADGLPLALELAAARLRHFTPEEIAARIEARLELLSSDDLPAGRHRNLRAALDWSFDLLTEEEQVMFARIGAFVGGCRLDAVEAVCGVDLPRGLTLDLLGRLVDKSLVQVEEWNGRSRYVLLETVREFACEKLEERPDADEVRHRTFRWCLEFAERSHEELEGPNQVEWSSLTSLEQPNLDQSLEWALAGADPTGGARLATILGRYWLLRGEFTHCARWLRVALDSLGDDDPVLRALALQHLAVAMPDQGAAARQMLEEAADVLEAAGELADAARARCDLSLVLQDRGDLEGCGAEARRAVDLAQRAGGPVVLAKALARLADYEVTRGEQQRSRQLLQQADGLLRRCGNVRELAWNVSAQAMGAYREGDLEGARALYTEGRALHATVGHRYGEAWSLAQLAMIAKGQGDVEASLDFSAGALDSFASFDPTRAHGWAHRVRAICLLAAENPVAARQQIADAIEQHVRCNAAGELAWSYQVLAAIDAAEERWADAARHLGASERLFVENGERRFDEADQDFRDLVDRSRHALGEGFGEAWEEGRRLTMGDAMGEVWSHQTS